LKILLHYPILAMGGAENSTIRLTQKLVERGWQVDLVLTTGGGELEPRLDPRIQVEYLRDSAFGQRFLESPVGIQKLGLFFSDLLPYAWTRILEQTRFLKYRSRTYDAAFIGLQGLSARFCCEKVSARKRLLWIRNDANDDSAGRLRRNLDLFEKQIDHFVCVSQSVYDSLATCFPETRSRSLVLHNVIDADGMRTMAAQCEDDPYSEFSRGGLRVVTVCRLLDAQKRLLRMLNVHLRLLEEGLNFTWYIVGSGPDQKMLEEKIAHFGCRESFRLLGPKENPFPYYKFADVSATLSDFEGLCGAVNEGKIMGKAIIATDFAGVGEQIEDGKNGLIVERNEDAIFEGMKRILSDKELRYLLTNTFLPKSILDDDYKIDKLERILKA
jgi:glycosyltransferase involved in cell wall biosynthesis